MIRKTVAKAFGRSLEFQGPREVSPSLLDEEQPLVKKVQRAFEDLHALFQEKAKKLQSLAPPKAEALWRVSAIETRPQGLEFRVSFAGGICRWLCPLHGHFLRFLEAPGRARLPVLYTFQPDEEGILQLVAKPLGPRALGWKPTSLQEALALEEIVELPET